MRRGNITRRGKSSWRLKFDTGRDPITGKRVTRLVTVNGKRQDAEKELTRLLREADGGTLVEPSRFTVADCMQSWLNGPTDLAAKTLERYRQLSEQQIIPHIGTRPLQKLRPADVQVWHAVLIERGGKGGKPLSARTVGHAHRVLHRALERAVTAEIVSRNVASAITPPKVEHVEVEALTAGQMADVLGKLEGHRLYPLAALALGTGLRRGELLALSWREVDLDGALLKVERSLEETKGGLRFKVPKTRHGRRTLSLPTAAIEPLRAHRKSQLEMRMALGIGRPEPDALVFSHPDGSPMSPDNLSRDWRRAVKALGLPEIMFHALRHSHASALIASGIDVLTVSRRLGHGTPVVTLTTYAHLFRETDTAAAQAIENAMRTPIER